MKKKLHLFSLVLLSMFIFALSSCEDDDSESKKDYLINNHWKMVGLVIEPPISDPVSGLEISDMMADMEECDKDDITIFMEDGTVQGEEGAIKCDPNDPDVYNAGTWAMSSDEKKLNLTEEGITVTFDINELNDNTLIISAPFEEFFEIMMDEMGEDMSQEEIDLINMMFSGRKMKMTFEAI